MIHTAVCIPHGGPIRPEFFRYLTEMEAANPDVRFTHVEVDTMIIGKARNILVQTALSFEPRPDVVLFIDDDVLIKPDVGKLIQNCLTLGIVSGLYFNRRPPYTPQMYTLAEEEEYLGMYWPVLKYEEGIVEVDAVGCGCLAVASYVFDILKVTHHPRFLELSDHAQFPSLRHIVKNLSPWFEFLDSRGEDMYFCERAKEAGLHIWVDTTVKCAHMGEIEITEEHFRYLVDNGLLQRQETLKV